MRAVEGGATALMYACQQCRETQVLELIRKQPQSVRERDRTAKTPLHYCAENADTNCAEALLRAAPELVDAQDDNGYCPLHLAVIAGNRALVKLLIARGADVNRRDDEGHSAVHWAIVSSEREALEMIIRAGADPSAPDVRGGYPLHYAVQMCGSICGCDYSRSFEDAIGVVETLLNFGVDVNVKDKDSRQPILWAASAGSADAVIHLVSAGACVEAADKDGLTALHCAASRGHTTTLETLISLCGAHVDVIDGNGCSALFYSVTLGHADATELLLRLGAEPNRQDRKGRTPAHCGAAKGQLETLRILQKHGGDLWLRNVKGDIPLHEAVASGRKDLVLWLLSQNPEAINLANNDGRCPLHIASMYNNTEMVKVLLDAKALVNPVMRTSKGVLMTPLNVALCRGHRSCGKYLQLHGGVPFSKVARLEPASGLAVRVSPSDEVADSAEANKESSSHGNTLKGKRGSEESEKVDIAEKKKVYRRRRKKKNEANAPAQDTESEDDGSDVKMKKSANRRMKKSGGKDGLEGRTKGRKFQQDAKNIRTGGSPNQEDDGVAEDVATAQVATETKAPHSPKSFSETKNVSQLSPEDFPAQMQAIDQLDAVIAEPDVEEHRAEGGAGGPGPRGTVATAKATQETDGVAELAAQNVRTEDDHRVEVKEEVKKQAVSPQEASIEIPKTERMQITESEKCSEGDSSKAVQPPNTATSSGKDDTQPKCSDGSDSNKRKKAFSPKGPKMTAADQAKKSSPSEPTTSRESGQERERALNAESAADEEGKNVKGGNGKPETELAAINCNDVIVVEDKSERNPSEVVKSEEARPEGVVTEENVNRETNSDRNEESEGLITFSSSRRLVAEPKKEVGKEMEMSLGKEEQTGRVDGLKQNKENKRETKIEAESELEKKEENEKGKEIEEHEIQEEKEKEEPFQTAHSEEEKPERRGKSEKGRDSNRASGDERKPTGDTEEEKGVSNGTDSPRGSAEPGDQDGAEHLGICEGSSASAAAEGRSAQIAFKKELNGRAEPIVERVEENKKSGLVQEFPDSKASDEIEKTGRKTEEEKERGKRKEEEERSKEEENEETSPDERKEAEEKAQEEEEGSGAQGKERAEAEAKERQTAKGTRVRRLCRRQKDFRADMSNASVTQLVQNTLRKYHMERGIFYQLLELKRYQIRSGRANEQVLVKRLADGYERERALLGMKPYSGLYRFREFEKFLYDQLKALNARRGLLVPEGRSCDDIDALSAFLNKSRYRIIDEVPRPQMTCTCITQRCHHSACAYTSVPCAAYITDLRRLRRPKPKREGLLPCIDQPPPPHSDADQVVGRPATLELVQGTQKHVIPLPQSCPDRGRRYYVTFTIKGAPAPKEDDSGGEASAALFKHRHAKSV